MTEEEFQRETERRMMLATVANPQKRLMLHRYFEVRLACRVSARVTMLHLGWEECKGVKSVKVLRLRGVKQCADRVVEHSGATSDRHEEDRGACTVLHAPVQSLFA